MTRQKVDPDKRQRTAHACDSCKRRKQKCDGNQPCAACSRRQFDCCYSNNDAQGSTTPDKSTVSDTNSSSSSPVLISPTGSTPTSQFLGNGAALGFLPSWPRIEKPFVSSPASDSNGFWHAPALQGPDLPIQMPPDEQGRRVFIGTSASTSFLLLIRMLVKNVVGPSSFTKQLNAAEQDLKVSTTIKNVSLLPTKETACLLVDSFFTHTNGTIELFRETNFVERVHKTYRNRSQVEPSWLCQLYLVIAIGLALATPMAGHKEANSINTLLANHPHRDEEYFLAARNIADRHKRFEEGDLWSVQALTLMSLYMLCKSKRNSAYMFVGMAVRSAHAHGLHEFGTLSYFEPTEQEARKTLWRTLFVLDVFLAVSLGRPLAMSDTDVSSPILHPSILPQSVLEGPEARHVCAAALEATLLSCHTSCRTLKVVYQSKGLQINEIQALAQECRNWIKKRAPFLAWQKTKPCNVRQSVASLNCNLNHYHSVILLSRPLFLRALACEISQEQSEGDPAINKKLREHSNICQEASLQTITLVNAAYMGGYLPRLNPFASYYVFAAALVLYINELIMPSDPDSRQWMGISIMILEYCGVVDPQARQDAETLTLLRDVIYQHHGHHERYVPTEQFHDHLAPTPPLSTQQNPFPHMVNESTLSNGSLHGTNGDLNAFYHQGLDPIHTTSSIHPPGQPFYHQPNGTHNGIEPGFPTHMDVDPFQPHQMSPSPLGHNPSIDGDGTFDGSWEWTSPSPFANEYPNGQLPNGHPPNGHPTNGHPPQGTPSARASAPMSSSSAGRRVRINLYDRQNSPSTNFL